MEIMKKLALLIGTLTTFAPLPVHSKFVQEYDQFQDVTTVAVVPAEQWDGKTPALNVSSKITPNKKRNLLFFTVIVPSRRYASGCDSGVTGVLADGVRLVTADETMPVMKDFPNTEAVGGTNPRQTEFMRLYARYNAEEFKKLSSANSVRYQLCGDSKQVFELSAEEIKDLRKYISVVLP
jgi:hypothetical protein